MDLLGNITEFNLKLAEITGHERQRVLGQPLASLLTHAAEAQHGMQQALSGERMDHELFFTHAKTGAEVALSVSMSPQRKGSSHGGPMRLAGLIMVGMDVTQQRRLMEDCARLAGDYSALVSQSPTPVLCMDVGGRITEWNRALEAVTGAAAQSVVGRKLLGDVISAGGGMQLASEEMNTALSACLVNAVCGSSKESAAVLLKLADGRQVDLIITTQARRDGTGTVVGVFCFAQDVSMRRAMETATKVRQAAEAAAEAKTRQLSVLCHEIRNPLNGIMGNVAALEDEIQDAGLLKVITTTMSCVHQLRRTVDDMLDLSKLEEGKLAVERRPFSMALMLEAVVAQVGHAASDKGLVMYTDLTACEGDFFVGDAMRIQQIIANFAWNACKFTETGSLTIRVETEPVADSPGKLNATFKCIDTGCGIEPKLQSKLFEPWSMLDDPSHACSTAKWGGSGLGLSICKSLATFIGGKVGVSSAPGTGSTFMLHVGIERAGESEIAGLRRPPLPQPAQAAQVAASPPLSATHGVLETAGSFKPGFPSAPSGPFPGSGMLQGSNAPVASNVEWDAAQKANPLDVTGSEPAWKRMRSDTSDSGRVVRDAPPSCRGCSMPGRALVSE